MRFRMMALQFSSLRLMYCRQSCPYSIMILNLGSGHAESPTALANFDFPTPLAAQVQMGFGKRWRPNLSFPKLLQESICGTKLLISLISLPLSFSLSLSLSLSARSLYFCSFSLLLSISVFLSLSLSLSVRASLCGPKTYRLEP